MRRFKFAKLVRDKIPDHMSSANQRPVGMRTLNDEEFTQELVKKLREEIDELSSAENREEMRKELADIQELVDELADVLNLSEQDLSRLQDEKRGKNGGFKKRIYLEAVDVPDDNKWISYYESQPDKYQEVKD